MLKVEPRDTPIVFEYVAQTQSPQEVNIVARVNGFLEKQAYTEGAIVKEGQLLFQMDQKPFIAQVNEAKAAWDKAKAAHDTALANLNRVKPLAAQNALSKKDLDDATGSEQSSAASLAGAKANLDTAELNLSYTTIASPLNGVSAAAQQKVGAYLNPANSQLTTVSSLHPMWVNFSISENEFSAYRDQVDKGPDHPAEEPQLCRRNRAGRRHACSRRPARSPSSIPRSIRRPARSCCASTVAESGLRAAAQPVRARAREGRHAPRSAILVPQRAVQQGAKGHFVWVMDADGKAELRPVVPGDWYGDNWIINAGLAAGDQVMVDGALKLLAGAQVKATPYEPGAKAGTPAVKPPAEPGEKDAAPAAAKK